ncbi:MAG: DUF6516 family protein [Candidatus Competibacteraceae bacterium]
MIEARHYLSEVKTRLATSAVITVIEVITERDLRDRGYFCARLILANGDFLEVSEYFIVKAGKLTTVEYRYQWMDPPQQKLVKRWDNAEHFHDLPHFPHHVHVGDEEQVVPGWALSILDLIDLIEQKLGIELEKSDED